MKQLTKYIDRTSYVVISTYVTWKTYCEYVIAPMAFYSYRYCTISLDISYGVVMKKRNFSPK